MLNRFVAGFMSVAMLVCTTSANAALQGYLKIKGQKSGDVKGGVIRKDHEGAIAVVGANHEIRRRDGHRQATAQALHHHEGSR
jgi:type VI protein secretion system component Hcp